MALAFAGKSVAVSAISMIVRKSFDYLEKYAKAEGMKSVQERLERALPQVQVVFDAIDMERIRDQSEALDAWLWQLRDAVEEAEDVLDEVEYYKLEKEVKTRGNKVSSSLYKCKRVVVRQFNSTFKAGTFKRLLDAIRKLDEIVVGVERFVLLVDRLDSCTSRQYVIRRLYKKSLEKEIGKKITRKLSGCPLAAKLNGCLLVSGQLGNLISLRHIYFSGILCGFRPYFGYLTSLQDLNDVYVPLKFASVARELADLKDLCYLSIHCLENVNAEEATLAKLDEKEYLIMLSLTWKSSQQESYTEEQVLDNLEPHMNLTKLKINGYNGSRSPCWLGNTTIINLTYLYISDCSYWQHLPPLGELPSLKYLYLICLISVKRLDSSFYGCEQPFGFPSLEYIFIECLPALEEWVEMEGEHLFPQLKALAVMDCKELRNIPALPSTLTYLEMDSVGLTTLHEPYVPNENAEPQKSSLSRLKICRCPYLETLEQLNQFLYLEELCIEHSALPPIEVWKSLIALSCLEIVSCHELADLNGMEELTSLTELKVIGCNKLEELPVVSSQQFQASEHNQVVTACTSYLGRLENLRISSPFVLQWFPLRSVTSVTNMTINSCRCLPEEWLMQNCNHLQRIGVRDASHLEFLPSIMASLTSLESLQFSRAMLIQSLPELPSSLRRLQILGCNPVLMRRCRKSRGRDWHKIAHIPDLRIVEDEPSSYSLHSYM
uniref:Uncharacterized protein n=1 Tax=Oryza barthii TaxID=65489 RepID=A0A0D3FUY1_9ORYZ